jgi:putative PIN family toxin of toxin-antitoxin system
MTAGPAGVFDCNVFLQAMLSRRGAAYACWQHAVEGTATIHVTARIIAEIRKLPEHKSLKRFGRLTQDRVDRFIEEVLTVAQFVEDPPEVFRYARDPDDAHYVNVAVATGSFLIVSNDKDLLDLNAEDNPDGREIRTKYTTFAAMTPAQFLKFVERTIT